MMKVDKKIGIVLTKGLPFKIGTAVVLDYATMTATSLFNPVIEENKVEFKTNQVIPINNIPVT